MEQQHREHRGPQKPRRRPQPRRPRHTAISEEPRRRQRHRERRGILTHPDARAHPHQGDGRRQAPPRHKPRHIEMPAQPRHRIGRQQRERRIGAQPGGARQQPPDHREPRGERPPEGQASQRQQHRGQIPRGHPADGQVHQRRQAHHEGIGIEKPLPKEHPMQCLERCLVRRERITPQPKIERQQHRAARDGKRVQANHLRRSEADAIPPRDEDEPIYARSQNVGRPHRHMPAHRDAVQQANPKHQRDAINLRRGLAHLGALTRSGLPPPPVSFNGLCIPFSIRPYTRS